MFIIGVFTGIVLTLAYGAVKAMKNAKSENEALKRRIAKLEGWDKM